MAAHSTSYSKSEYTATQEIANLQGKNSLLKQQAELHQAEHSRYAAKAESAEAKLSAARSKIEVLEEKSSDDNEVLARYRAKYFEPGPTDDQAAHQIPTLWGIYFEDGALVYGENTVGALIKRRVIRPITIDVVTPQSPGSLVHRRDLQSGSFKQRGYHCFTAGNVVSSREDGNWSVETQTDSLHAFVDQVLSRLLLQPAFELARVFLQLLIPLAAGAARKNTARDASSIRDPDPNRPRALFLLPSSRRMHRKRTS
jgi:hypothetical protein